MATRRYLLAEYPDDEALLGAARRIRELGHTSLDLHSPYPLPGADEALGLERSRVPLIALLGGLAGLASAVVMQVWTNAIDYPLNVGNRLLVPYPALVPVIFELGVLLAAGSIFFGLMGLFGFPRLHHPVFEVEAFRSAAVDALWLSVEVPEAEAERVADELHRLGARQVELGPQEGAP